MNLAVRVLACVLLFGSTATAQMPGPPGGAPTSRPGEGPPKAPRRGIPVTEPLLYKHCSTCHKTDENGLMSRISYLRKTPEGWEQSLKRMARQLELGFTAEEARSIVAYLANEHGLTRSEAERSLYEVERRVHWSEAEQDADFRATCGACHTLGRVLAQQRDPEEWKILKNTHLAFFPLARMQAFQGDRRGGGGGGGGPPEPDWASMTEDERMETWERRQEEARRGPDRADRVLERLAKDQPLFTKEWDEWQVSRRETPLAGRWVLKGREIGRGDFYGAVTVVRTAENTFTTTWETVFSDGRVVRRTGKGILYAGYSWRGRSTPAAGTGPPDADDLRETLLLSADWNTLKGRIFRGGYDEIGADVTLTRETGATFVLGAVDGAVTAPALGHVVEIYGSGFPADLTAADFFVGAGATVASATRLDERRVRLVLDVSPDAERGPRAVSFRAVPGPAALVVYDAIDYVKIEPGEGFARIGGGEHPKQIERYEAVAMNRGKDDKPFTADDFPIKVVKGRWGLEEMAAWADDDDVKYVGVVDPDTGVFTPAAEGPNPARRHSANNIGDVFVTVTASLETPESRPAASRPASRPESAASRPESRPASRADGEAASRPTSLPAAAVYVKPTPRPASRPSVSAKTFRARAHLLVGVPLYVRWDRFEWDRR